MNKHTVRTVCIIYSGPTGTHNRLFLSALGRFLSVLFSPFHCPTESASEDKEGQSEWGCIGVNMEKPTILAGAHDNADRKTVLLSARETNTPHTTERHDTETPVQEKNGPAGMQSVRERSIDNRDFLKTQPNSSCRHGDTLQNTCTTCTSENGNGMLVKGKWIKFHRL